MQMLREKITIKFCHVILVLSHLNEICSSKTKTTTKQERKKERNEYTTSDMLYKKSVDTQSSILP